ncbi:hypothetical protein L1987_06630 [Smallanthus sonchifolius]|uniref:Uncharacterized protein n=1 Tax=Smallanthus sonchifolius TaxID=185202 RepID=A0ACB9JZ14_9ASTR|nr:hypothetical protein L1987_06630 [Smallanthus sonchifolius]
MNSSRQAPPAPPVSATGRRRRRHRKTGQWPDLVVLAGKLHFFDPNFFVCVDRTSRNPISIAGARRNPSAAARSRWIIDFCRKRGVCSSETRSGLLKNHRSRHPCSSEPSPEGQGLRRKSGNRQARRKLACGGGTLAVVTLWAGFSAIFDED